MKISIAALDIKSLWKLFVLSFPVVSTVWWVFKSLWDVLAIHRLKLLINIEHF